MRALEPVLVGELFPEVLEALLSLLRSLAPSDWDRVSACDGWSVKDVALHLLGDEVGNLSRRRDGFSVGADIGDWPSLVAFINQLNGQWVEASRRISVPLLIDLLEHLGRQSCDYFGMLDPHAMGGPVSWAGLDPAPVWLDLAREYTERWLHQQHIRDAVGAPGLAGPRYLSPVLQTFVHALPKTFEGVSAPEGTLVSLVISGPSGGRWALLRTAAGWSLGTGVAREPDAQAILTEESAWRLFTRGLDSQAATDHLSTGGDEDLARKVLEAVSIIA